MSFEIENLDNFPPEANPFHYDGVNMGVKLGLNAMFMISNHVNEECLSVILVNITTGERIRIKITPEIEGG